MHKQGWVALALAIVAAGLTYYYISEKEAAIRSAATPIQVLVAKTAIARGARLTADKVTVEEVPGAFVMPGAVSAPERADLVKSWEALRNQFAIVPIAKGEHILPNKLSALQPGFAGVVPEGKRVITLELDLGAAVGGQLKPGNHVDVLGTFEYQIAQSQRTTSVVLAQDILVTAVDNETTAGSEPRKKDALVESRTCLVGLAILPEDAVRLALAEKEGTVKLALRSLGDERILDLPDHNLGTVLGPLLKIRREDIRPVKKAVPIFRGIE